MQNTPNIYPLLWMEGKTEQWMTKYHEKITIVSHRCQIVRSVTYIAIIRLVFTVSHRNGCRTLSYFFTNKPNFHILVYLCMDNVNHPNRHTCRMVMKSSKQEFSHKTKWDRIARDLKIVNRHILYFWSWNSFRVWNLYLCNLKNEVCNMLL